MSVLVTEPLGSFMVRKSETQPGSLALSVRVPKTFHPLGITHYIIIRVDNGYQIKVTFLAVSQPSHKIHSFVLVSGVPEGAQQSDSADHSPQHHGGDAPGHPQHPPSQPRLLRPRPRLCFSPGLHPADEGHEDPDTNTGGATTRRCLSVNIECFINLLVS